jgi:hypothetical protein
MPRYLNSGDYALMKHLAQGLVLIALLALGSVATVAHAQQPTVIVTPMAPTVATPAVTTPTIATTPAKAFVPLEQLLHETAKGHAYLHLAPETPERPVQAYRPRYVQGRYFSRF